MVAKVVLVAALVVAGLYSVYLIRDVIGLVLISVFFALAIAPPVERLDELGLPRWLAILVVYLAIAAAIVGIGLLIVPPLVEGIDGLSEDIPSYVEDLRQNETFREYDDRYDITSSIEEQAAELPSRLGDAAGTLRDVTVGVFSSFVQLFSILVITFFLMIEGKRLLAFFYRQLPPEREKRLHVVADDISDAISGYVFGAFVIAILAGGITFITLSALSVPFALPLAIIFGFFCLIPLVGATIGGILVAIVVAFTSFPVGLLIWVAVLVVYQQVENNLIVPKVYGTVVRIHPLAVIIAILIGATLLGVLGALIAIPAAAAVQAVVRDFWEYSDRNLGRLAASAAANIDPEDEPGDAALPDVPGTAS
ncbi:MAG: AI-2E family transporter [Actinomycetota bacterium]|nr:AI-2E family transporter [Actinomycetota bacterium]